MSSTAAQPDTSRSGLMIDGCNLVGGVLKPGPDTTPENGNGPRHPKDDAGRCAHVARHARDATHTCRSINGRVSLGARLRG